ncbi:MAG TPA: hypothetical protein VGV57_03180 [Thermoleophilaceae bacterium]|nr:hypothetical protein [Thermoleophilaceae bacterium]
MATEERATGTPDHVYNAVTALSNSLRRAHNTRPTSVMRQAGDDELAGFFREAQQEDQRRAEELKQLLNTRLVTSS